MTLTLSRNDLYARIERVLGEARRLREIEEAQQELRPGFVRPVDARRRSSYANRICEQCQALQFELGESDASADVRQVRALAESVLRENPVIQAAGALDVLKFQDIPDRYVIGPCGTRELRKGFGLHRQIKNDAGGSVVIAYTQPGHKQVWHAHTVNEDTLAVDGAIHAEFMDGRVRELESRYEDMFHFEAETFHTLVNPSQRDGRTLTVKSPLGISVWLPVSKPADGQAGAGEVYGPQIRESGKWGDVRVFSISDSQHQYSVEIFHLAPAASVSLTNDADSYIYVLNGSLSAGVDRNQTRAVENELVVAAPTHNLRVASGATGARLYRVNYSESKGGWRAGA